MVSKKAKLKTRKAPQAEKILSCGIVMPISGTDGYSSDHWNDVRAIITEAVDALNEPAFATRLVSDADESGVIQKRIVQNVYSTDMVVCDVSGKNPNVMFELGMRLAFDKPVVIVKDDKTDYSFDTGVIEHLTYPRDLRFPKIVEFKALLGAKVAATYRNSEGPSATSFLKNFGQFEVASLSETSVPAERLLLESIESLRDQMRQLQSRPKIEPSGRSNFAEGIRELVRALKHHPNQRRVRSPRGIPLPELESYLMSRIEPQRYFPRYSDFVEAMRTAIDLVRVR